MASVEGVIGALVAAGDGEDAVGGKCRVGESVGRGVTVVVSRGCEVGVALCKGVAVVVPAALGAIVAWPSLWVMELIPEPGSQL
jgi:hypothetical protein